MLMKYGAPVYCVAVQTKQLSWSAKCTTVVLVKHGTPVYCLAVQVKQLSWGAKRTTGVPWFLLQNCNLKRDSTHYTPSPLTARNTLTFTADTKLDSMGSS